MNEKCEQSTGKNFNGGNNTYNNMAIASKL
jgi:hypothetical protein